MSKPSWLKIRLVDRGPSSRISTVGFRFVNRAWPALICPGRMSKPRQACGGLQKPIAAAAHMPRVGATPVATTTRLDFLLGHLWWLATTPSQLAPRCCSYLVPLPALSRADMPLQI